MSILTLLTAATLAAQAPAFVEKPCADPKIAALARCGTVEVPEDRGKAGGRRIGLNLIILAATGGGAKLPPLFDIDGGPGLPVTKNAGFYLTEGSAYRAGREIVLVDQRGTGGSNPLHCPELSTPEAAYRPLYPEAAVEACRKRLERSADLTRYGTDDAVADLDAVRAALGYERVDLFGLSYGTTVALRYMTKHPERVRATVLLAVAPASARPPSQHARAAERGFDLVAAQCRADARCGTAFDPAVNLDRALRRLGSVKGAPPPEIFTEKLRSLMYSPVGARRVPFVLRRAADGDLAPFFAATRPLGQFLYADGMYLSVTCSESLALMDYEAAAAASRATRFGDYRLRRQRAACSKWPTRPVASDFLAPARSNAAVLLVSGELDPVSPPDWAREVARHLPNSRHLLVPHGGHVLDGLSGLDTCFDPLVLRFLETADPVRLDATCLAEMKPPPFATADKP